jgi:hypothetical protein
LGITVSPDRVILTGVSYIEASFQASWTDVSVFAEVTFPDVLSVDVVTPTDLLAKSTTKALRDIYSGFIDVAALGVDKSLSDSFLMEDDVDIDIWIEKYFAEIQNLVDEKALAFDKGTISNAVTATEVKVYALTKALADSISQPVELVARTVNKVFADSISFTDVAAAFKLYIRNFDDSVTVPDFDFLDVIPEKTELALATDEKYWSVSKNLSEGITLVDGMDGDLDFLFIKVVSELILPPSDAKFVDFQPNKADNVSTSSDGVLAVQDYCDITYFLQDYVGTSRTIT